MKDNTDITQQAYIHLGELEESVNIDVAVKHVHGGTWNLDLKWLSIR